jgi:cell division ATPase FtsA
MPEIDVVSVSVGAKTIKNVNVTVNKNFGSAKIVTPQMLDDLLTECGKKVERPDVVIFDIFPLSYHLDGKRQDEPEGQTATQIVANYNVLYGHNFFDQHIGFGRIVNFIKIRGYPFF